MATGCLQGFISSFTELELKMNGIERVKYYTEVKTEAPYEQADDPSRSLTVAPPGWPARGAVSFRGASARYRCAAGGVQLGLISRPHALWDL